MTRPKHDLFISHSSDDSAAAKDLRAMFEGAGYSVWMAPDDIVGSRPWAEQIVEAIDNSRAMIVLLSSSANDSPYVSREVNLAFSRKRAVLPIRLEPVPPEAALELFLALVQRVDAFPPPVSAHRDVILRRLELTLDEQSSRPRRRPAARPKPAPAASSGAPQDDSGEATHVPGAPAAPAPVPTAAPAPSPAPGPAPDASPTPASTPTPVSAGSLGVGSRVGAFTIEAVLGEGGMATVYRARQDEPNRPVALKVIRADHAADPTYRQRFLSEKDTLASLEHPSIIPIYAAGDDHGVLYIAMRLVDGNDLAARIKREGHLSLQETIEILEPIADAVDYAHAKGVVHRDLKPSNIVLDREGRPYLTDFGLGKRIRTADTDASSGLSTPGIAVGTLAYMAPEQLAGEATEAGAPGIDLYAFGAIAFTCLTGHAPYPNGTPEQLAVAQAGGQVPSVLADRPDLSKAVDTVLRRALARRPADRYPTARALVAALEAASVVSDQSTEIIKVPGRVQPWQSALAWTRSASTHAIVAAVLVLALAFGAVKGWGILTGGGTTPTPTPTQASQTPGPTAAQATATPLVGPPDPPAAFSAQSPFAAGVDLSWVGGQAGITGYHLYRDDIPIRDAAPTDTTLRDFGLLPATTYHYAIEAFGPSGLSTRQDVPVTTRALPTSARLEGSLAVALTYTESNYTSLKVGTVQNETWQFTPECPSGACSVTLSGVHGNTQITGTLELQADGSYSGSYTYTYDGGGTCGTMDFSAPITLTPKTSSFTIAGEYLANTLTGAYSDTATSAACAGHAKADLAATTPGTVDDLIARLNADPGADRDAMSCAALDTDPAATLKAGLLAKADCTVSGRKVQFYLYPSAGATASAFTAFLARDEAKNGGASCSANPPTHGDGAWSVPGNADILGRVWCGPGTSTWTYTWSYLPSSIIGFAEWPDGPTVGAFWADPAHWLAPGELP